MVKNHLSDENVGSIFSGKRSQNKKAPVPSKAGREQTENVKAAPARTPEADSGKKGPTARRTYTSLMLDMELYNKIREIAKINRLPYNELMDSAMRKFIELYEAKNGPVDLAGESNISADSLI